MCHFLSYVPHFVFSDLCTTEKKGSFNTWTAMECWPGNPAVWKNSSIKSSFSTRIQVFVLKLFLFICLVAFHIGITNNQGFINWCWMNILSATKQYRKMIPIPNEITVGLKIAEKPQQNGVAASTSITRIRFQSRQIFYQRIPTKNKVKNQR